jgi:hypothetical protein
LRRKNRWRLALPECERFGLVYARELVRHRGGDTSVLPARSRRFISSTSASGLLRRSRPSSCVSSPMAKYTSCWRAHGPQKATPRISTSARRGQGLSVLLRTWQDPCFVVTSVKEPSVPQLLDCLFEGVARAEGRNLLGRDLHFLTGLGIHALPGLSLSVATDWHHIGGHMHFVLIDLGSGGSNQNNGS